MEVVEEAVNLNYTNNKYNNILHSTQALELANQFKKQILVAFKLN
jgi:hypothetical protein